MKTVLVEPLTISKDLLEDLASELNQSGHSFIHYDSKPTNPAEWMERVGDADQVILANTKMPAEVINQAPNLKYINIAFTGVDHVPVGLAKEKGILVSNAAGYSDQAVAELVIGMTISLLRKLKLADPAVRAGGRAADFLGSEIAGKTVGIIGTGKIGKRVAELFKAFGARLVGYNRSEHEDVKALGLTYLSLEEVLAQSDILTVHLPQNDQTKAFIGKDQFARMKPSAIFINCARGPIIDQSALVEALDSGRIAAAAIDVFDQEPPLDQEDSILSPEQTLLTPHVGYFTEEAMEKRARIVFENAVDFVQGREVKTLI